MAARGGDGLGVAVREKRGVALGVSVAAGEAEPAAGLPVRSGLPVAARVGLSVALVQLLAVEVPEAEARPEVVAQAEEPTEALPEAEEPPEALPEARAEGLLVGVALWQSVCEAEGESLPAFGTLPVAVMESVQLGEPVAGLLGEPVAQEVGVGEVRALGLGVRELVLQALGERVREDVPKAEGESVPEGLQEVAAHWLQVLAPAAA